MALIANDILKMVALQIVSPIVSTTLQQSIDAGTQTATPVSMNAIYAGAALIVGAGATQEVVTVASVTATTFTATFANPHFSGDAVTAATFPEGQTQQDVFNQNEMLAYLAATQNDFLEKTRAVIVIGTVNFSSGIATASLPTDAIVVHRISIGGSRLYDESQMSLDLAINRWGQSGQQPRFFYQDKLPAGQVGFFPAPSNNGTASVWYAQRGPQNLTPLSSVLVPFLFVHALKYGVLARALSKDGVQNQPETAKYCQQRYDAIVLHAQQFLDGVLPKFRGRKRG